MVYRISLKWLSKIFPGNCIFISLFSGNKIFSGIAKPYTCMTISKKQSNMYVTCGQLLCPHISWGTFLSFIQFKQTKTLIVFLTWFCFFFHPSKRTKRISLHMKNIKNHTKIKKLNTFYC